MENLDQSDFINWLEQPITHALYIRLKELDENLKETLLNPGVVLSEDGQLHYARITGNREMIDMILQLSIEDFKTEEETDKYETQD
jgi:hypothetical protein